LESCRDDYYEEHPIEPKPTKADIESFDKSMFSFNTEQ
jgi:hypothetical protein